MDSKDKSTKSRVTLPYGRGSSEALSRVFHQHGVVTSMKLHLTLKRIPVRPKDKHTLLEHSGVMYQLHVRIAKTSIQWSWQGDKIWSEGNGAQERC